MPFIKLRTFPSIFSLLRVCIMTLCWFSKCFCCICWNDHALFLLSFNMVNYIDWFLNIELVLYSWSECIWLCCIVLFKYCCIWFTNILLIFSSQSIRNICVSSSSPPPSSCSPPPPPPPSLSSSVSPSLSDFDISVMIVLFLLSILEEIE